MMAFVNVYNTSIIVQIFDVCNYIHHLNSVSIKTVHAGCYFTGVVYIQTFENTKTHNGRPYFVSSNEQVIVEWGEFEIGGKMAWKVKGVKYVSRFVSFSDVYDPRDAVNWKYRKNDNKLYDAPKFALVTL